MSATPGWCANAPHYVIDRGVVGDPLGLDDELAHNRTLDPTPPRIRLRAEQ